jgi:ion channel-forming bestrophin family protein
MIVCPCVQVVCCLQVLSELIENADISSAQKLQMHNDVTEFNDILGGCERLLRTPIPLSYTRNSSRFIMMCLLFFPLATVTKLGLAVIPMTTFLSFLFLGALLIRRQDQY